jgi:predicted Zn-dependent protease
MGPGLRIVGVGAVEAPVLEGVGSRLAKHGFEPTVAAGGPAVAALAGPGMRRLQALLALPALRKEPGDHVLGLTEFEVTDGVKEWVYGMGEVNGRAAVFSVKPFRAGGLDGERTLDRLAAAILHELAHNVGMVHCRNKGCLMHATHEPAAMRQLDLSFCASCEGSWKRRLRITAVDGD